MSIANSQRALQCTLTAKGYNRDLPPKNKKTFGCQILLKQYSLTFSLGNYCGETQQAPLHHDMLLHVQYTPFCTIVGIGSSDHKHDVHVGNEDVHIAISNNRVIITAL